MSKRRRVPVICCAVGIAIIIAVITGFLFLERRHRSSITAVGLTEREAAIASFSGDMFAVMELDYSKYIGERKIYLEEWSGGRKIRSDIVAQGSGNMAETMVYYISSDIEKKGDGSWTGTRWKMMYENDGARVVSGEFVLPFPAGKLATGGITGIYGKKGDKPSKIKSGHEYVLAARCFQFDGSPVKGGMAEEWKDSAAADAWLKEYEYVVLLRLVIS